MADEMKKGDTVKLKSGGPKMTVEAAFKDAGGFMCVRCSWFDKQDKRHAEAFEIDAVEVV